MSLKFKIEVDDKGNVAVSKLSRNTKKLKKNTDSTSKAVKKLAGAYIGIQGVKIIGRLVLETTKLVGENQALEQAFDSLGTRIGFNNKSFDKLSSAVDGTVTDMDLMKQANNAMLLGIVESDEQMAQLFDTAQRLAKAVGKDAAFGIESLVTGMGRQSKLMLDNLGIMVKSEDAYKRFAASVGKSVQALTDQERKTAFINEAMKQAKNNVDALGEETINSADNMRQMSAAAENLQIAIGELLEPAFVSIANTLSQRVIPKLIDVSQEFKKALGIGVVGQIEQTKLEIERIEAAIERTSKPGVGGKFLAFMQKAFGEEVTIGKGERAQEAVAFFNKQLAEANERLSKLIDRKRELTEGGDDKGDKKGRSAAEQTEALELNKERLILIDRQRESLLKVGEADQSLLEAENERFMRELEIFAMEEDALKKQKELRLNMIQSSISNMSQLVNMFKDSNTEIFALAKGLAIAEATMNTFVAATKALAEGGPIFGPILAASTVALGLATVAKIAGTSFKAREGFIVGGNGGPTSDSEVAAVSAGERTLSSKQVNTLGGQSAISDAIQAGAVGGGSSGITININGNVIGQESYIQDTLLPAIRSEIGRE